MFLPRSNILFALIVVMLFSAVSASTVYSQTIQLPDGSTLDLSALCPTCNMKIAASTLGPAALVLTDGKVVGFDGTADMFRYILDPPKNGVDPATIKHTYITEYGTKTFIDAKKAFYVIDSNVTGPMGPELVPFTKKEDAEKFMADHHGAKVVTYSEITLDDLKAKRKKLKMKEEATHEHGGMKH